MQMEKLLEGNKWPAMKTPINSEKMQEDIFSAMFLNFEIVFNFLLSALSL